MRIFGICQVRDEAEILPTTLTYNVSLGLERVLVADNASTDATARILNALGNWLPVSSWYLPGPFGGPQLRTWLARQAWREGADWVLMFDADEFWHIPTGLHALVRQHDGPVLSAGSSFLVQERHQAVWTPDCLLNMTRRPQAIAPHGRATRERVERGELSAVAREGRRKLLFRPTPDIVVNAHEVANEKVIPLADDEAGVLHVPYYARSRIAVKAERGRALEAQAGLSPDSGWHLRLLARRVASGALEREWASVSHQDGYLDVYGTRTPTVYDATLHDLLADLPVPDVEFSRATGCNAGCGKQRTPVRAAPATPRTDALPDSLPGHGCAQSSNGQNEERTLREEGATDNELLQKWLHTRFRLAECELMEQAVLEPGLPPAAAEYLPSRPTTFVQSAFSTILGRPPEEPECTLHEKLLRSGSSRTKLLDRLVTSLEFACRLADEQVRCFAEASHVEMNFLTAAYRLLLRREPEEAARENNRGRLSTLQGRVAQLRFIVRSEEFARGLRLEDNGQPAQTADTSGLELLFSDAARRLLPELSESQLDAVCAAAADAVSGMDDISHLRASAGKLAEEATTAPRHTPVAEEPHGPDNGRPLRLLFVAGFFPSFLHGGGLRLFDILRELGARHTVDLYSVFSPHTDEEALRLLKPYLRHVRVVESEGIDGADLERWLRRVADKAPYDAVALEYLGSVPEIPLVREFTRRTVFTLMESVAYRHSIDITRMARAREYDQAGEQFLKLLHEASLERDGVLEANHSIAVTEQDASFVEGYTGVRPHIIPTAISNYAVMEDVARLESGDAPLMEPGTVIFLGFYGHYPNIDAVRWYLNNVHERVREQVPGYRFLVVGAGNLAPLQEREYPDVPAVEWIGQVPHIVPAIARAAVCVSPLISGAGIRGKINQYSAVGRPTVSTPRGVYGTPYVHGESVHIAEDPAEFAAGVIALLTDEAYWNRMVQAARQVAEQFMWAPQIQRLESIYRGER